MTRQAAALISSFANTADLGDERDTLDSPAALVRWLAARGLVSRGARGTRGDLREALVLREALRDLACANNGCETDVNGASTVLDRAARGAGLNLRFHHGTVAIDAPAGGVLGALGRIAGAAAETMLDGTWPRVKACRADSCRWVFYDETRNRSRAWCDMSVCGNREKAQRFRERRAGSC